MTACLPVADRSISHPRQRYHDLTRSLAAGQAVHLAHYCRHQAGVPGVCFPPPGDWSALSPVQRTREQYLAYAAYWQSIADAQDRAS